MQFGLSKRLGAGILGVAVAVALLYFALLTSLFSKTYDMLTAALAAKGKAEAASLAARLPFALATDDRKEVAKILADFESKDAKDRSVVILDKSLHEVATSGLAASAWSSLRERIGSIKAPSSWSQERLVVSAAPAKNEDDLAGYVVTLMSLDDFHAVRSSLRSSAILIFLIGMAVIGTVASLLVKRFLVRPILSTEARLRDIAHGNGDLTQRLQADTNDEIGALATQFNGFAEKLQGIMRDVAERSSPLADEANALTAASTSLQSSVDQTVERVASVEQASQTMSSNTSTAASAVDTAMRGINSIATAVERMTESVSAIAQSSERASTVTQDVVVQAKQIDESMAELEKSALAIGKVTETITSISAQTNLLALNATIEAARAGAAGKGFAVVANEIKELAQQTAAATEDVKERIKGIQGSTQSALSGNARIATVISTINELVRSIAVSISEQARVAKDIASDIASANSGVAQANELVTSNAGVAQSIAKDVADVTVAANRIRDVSDGLRQNSGRLLNFANGLRELVTTFRY